MRGSSGIGKITFGISLALTFLFPNSASSQDKNIKFQHLTLEDGLSQSSVECVVQDSHGYIWISTQNGVNRFDGHEIKIFKPENENPKSISHYFVTSIVEDKDGYMWMGTNGGGLNKYDPEDESFSHYSSEEYNKHGLGTNEITKLFYDKDSLLWVGTNKGLYFYNPIQNKFMLYVYSDKGSKTNIRNQVYSIFEDTSSRLWVASNSGIFLLRGKDHETCVRIPEFDCGENGSTSTITDIAEDDNGFIWLSSDKGLFKHAGLGTSFDASSFSYIPIAIGKKLITTFSLVFGKNADKNIIFAGSHGDGLLQYNSLNGTYHFLQVEFGNSTSLLNNYVSCLVYDKTGMLWVGTEGGLCIFDKYTDKFPLITSLPYKDKNIPLRNLHSIVKDKNGLLWLASKSDGLYIIDDKNRQSYHLSTKSTKDKLLSNKIRTIMEDSKGNFWIGYDDAGLARMTWDSPNNYRIKNFSTIKSAPESIKTKRIYQITETANGEIWIGSEHGLHCYNYTTDSFKSYYNNIKNPKSLSENSVYRVYEEDERYLWIATFGGGLNIYDREKDFFTSYMHSQQDKESIPGNDVQSINKDSQGRTWIGISGQGLVLFNKEQNKFTQFDKRQDLPSNIVYDMLEDPKGNLWFSSNNGIFYIEPSSFMVTSFTLSDGLQSNEFNGGATFMNGDGIMYFGGKFGFNYFNPDNIKKNPYKPTVRFTDFQIFNKRILANDESSILKKSITETKEITLKHKQNLLTFSFSGMSYSGYAKNSYSYILEGFMDDWIDIGNDNSISFTNLLQGKYTLKVKASNNDGVWCEAPAKLTINVLSPPWKRWWAYLSYFVVLGLLIYALIQNMTTKITLVNDLKMAQFDRQKSIELNELKLKFFTNISHEFRTPLTLILSPIDNLLNNGRFTMKEMDQLKIIKKNAVYFLSLLDRLMTFRKLEKGKMKLRVGKEDLTAVINNCSESFTNVASMRKIKFSFDTKHKQLYGWFDKEKIEMLLHNLISNAFKYSLDDATINVNLKVVNMKNKTKKIIGPEIDEPKSGMMAQIEVSDTGIGIPKDKIEYIFERFAQVDTNLDQKYSNSMGIGLSLAQEIVDLHKGKMSVVSRENEGSTFTVLFPIWEDSYSKEEISNELPSKSIPITQDQYLSIPDALINDKNDDIFDDKEQVFPNLDNLPRLLIVEDNKELREFLVRSFNEKYHVISAVDGDDGLKKIFDKNPDIIISDVMMPGTDGLELCRRVRKEIGSHIPIILLTAKTMDESLFDGIESGADAYITKPFSVRYLDLRLRKLLESRRMVHEYFRLSDEIESDSLNLTSVEEQFLHKIMEVIEENISDSDFNVTELAESMAMSRSHLYRKLNALTGQIPKDFMKSVRLNHAARLLKKKKYSISDISYHVGFSDPKYFSKCFRKKFEVSPTAYSELKDTDEV